MSDLANEVIENSQNVMNSAMEGTNKFMNLLKDFNVIGFVLGLLMSNSVADIANSIIDSVVMPTIKPLLDKLSRENENIKIGGFTLHLEKFINALIKFLVLSFIIFIFITFGVSVSKPVSWVRIQELNPNVKL